MINIGLINENELLLQKVNDIPDALLNTVVKLLENQSLVIRGKSLLTVVLLVKHFPLQWFTLFISDNKFIQIIDRLTKDSYKYVQYGLMHFIDQLNATLPIILNVIQEDLVYALSQGDTKDLEVDAIVDLVMDRRKDFKNLKGHMTLVSLLLVAVNSSLLKNRIVNDHFLNVLGNIMSSCDTNLFNGADEFMNAVIAIVESISTNNKTLFNNTIPILQYVFPALIKNLKSDSNDVKFLSLKIFTDITIKYINDESIFDLQKLDFVGDDANNAISRMDNTCKFTTQLIYNILISDLLSNYKYFLDESDPVPLFAIKLLSNLTDRSYEFVNAIEKLGILPLIIEFYNPGNKKFNRHTIKIIKCIVEAPDITLDKIYSFGIIESTLNIIDTMLEQSLDWCFDVLTATLYSIIDKIAVHVELQETIEGDQNLEKAIENLISSVYSCIELLNTDLEFHVVDKASLCLISILTKFADRHKNEMYLTEQHFKYMIQALNSKGSANQTRIMQSLLWFLTNTSKYIKFLNQYRLLPSKQESKNDVDQYAGQRFHPFSRPQSCCCLQRSLQSVASHHLLSLNFKNCIKRRLTHK